MNPEQYNPTSPSNWPLWKVISVVAIGTTVFCGIFWVLVLSQAKKEVVNTILPAEQAAAQSSSAATAEVKKNEYPRIFAVGDIMLDRYVETLSQKNGADYPFRQIADFLKQADLVTANLEGPVTIDHVKTSAGSMRFSFATTVPALLYENNIQIVNIANNHTYDYGEVGYKQTRASLEDAKIRWAGHPKKISEDYVLFEKIKDLPVAVVGFHPLDAHFSTTKAGSLIQAIRYDNDSFIIVHIHWGDEYELVSNMYQKAIAHTLIDAGADVIIGHHPHVTQEVEVYKDRAIFYSLGNFIFDQYFSKDTEQGLAISMEFTDDTVSYTLHPLQSSLSQPALMVAEKSVPFLTTLAARSSKEISREIESGSFVLPRFRLEETSIE